jgi:hypothetical protein
MKPPTMPTEFFQLVIFVCTLEGLSPLLQPLPCLDHKPGSTVMPIAVDQAPGSLPAPPSYTCR